MIGALFAVLLLGAGATTTDDADLLQARRRKIEMLGQSDLNRLKRNYENFRKLSPERRAELFQFHEEIEEDTKSGGHLQKLLDDYNQWFSRLSPFEREKLLATADPAERAQLVAKLQEEQQKQQKLEQARAHAARFPALAVRTLQSAEKHALNPAQMEGVVTAIEKSFLEGESKDKRLQSPGRDRHLRILKRAMQQVQSERWAAKSARAKSLYATIVAALPDEKMKATIQSAKSPPQALGRIIRQSILNEWSPEIDGVHPTPDQVDEFIEKWKSNILQKRQREAFEKQLQNHPLNTRKRFEVELVLSRHPQLADLQAVTNWYIGPFVKLNGGRPAGPARFPRAGQRAKSGESASSEPRAAPAPAPAPAPARSSGGL